MNKNVALIIDSLFAGCNDEQKAKLTALYRDAYTSTAAYAELEYFVNNYSFYGVNGHAILNEAKTTVEQGMTHIGSYAANIAQMELLLKRLQKLDADTEQYINDFDGSDTEITIIRKSSETVLRKLLLSLINTAVYNVAVLYGAKYISGIKIDPDAPAADMLHSFNQEFADILEELKSAPVPTGWRILRKRMGGANLVPYDGFVIEGWQPTGKEAEEGFEAVTPFFYNSANGGDVLCCGIGRMITVMPADGMTLLNREITTSFPLNILNGRDMDYRNINVYTLLLSLAGQSAALIEPQQMAELLNRYFSIRTAQQLNDSERCLICGQTNCSCIYIPRIFNEN